MFLNNKSSQNEFHNLKRVNTTEIQAEQLIANAGLYDSEKITTPNQATTHETNCSSRFLLALIFYPYQHTRFPLCTAFKSGSFKKVLSQLSLAVLLFGLMNSSAHAELMQLYYSSARGDNFTAVSSSGRLAAKNAGYTRARNQGYLLNQNIPGSVPVQLWYHSGRGDHFSAVSTQGKTDARNAGYRFVRTQGYVYANWRPGTTAMKLWWGGARGDNFSTVTAAGENAARGAGYRYVRTQGYVYTSDHANTCINHAKQHYTIEYPGTVFNDHERLSWVLPKAKDCDDVRFYLAVNNSYDRELIPATGSQYIFPSKTAEYRFFVGYPGIKVVPLSSETVVRANIVTYPEAEDPIESRGMAEGYARMMLDNLSEFQRSRYQHWRIDIHLIPASLNLTDLAPYKSLGDKQTEREGDGNRKFKDLRGAGGVRDPISKTIYMAVGEEELVYLPESPADFPPGYLMFHEMGHTIMGQFITGENGTVRFDHFALTFRQLKRLMSLYNERLNDPNLPWLGNDSGIYTKESPEEYFAESVAAYFEFSISYANNDYTPEWLQANDPEMYDLLDELFACDGKYPSPSDPVCDH